MMQTNMILIVEDDSDDRDILLESIQNVAPESHLCFAENGLEALECLYELKDSEKPLPSLIILDLNMPYLSGEETYQKIKGDPALSQIPVVVFTSSTNPNDMALFKRRKVEFISKPYDFTRMQQLVTQMLAVAIDAKPD
jgi:CheY-like chemotaxis protein